MRLLALLCALSVSGCASSSDVVWNDGPEIDDPPPWAEGAIWYQIFPERFRNGDPTNDPTPESMTGSWPQVGADSLIEAGWAPTPWTHDWYEQEEWAVRMRPDDFYFGAQLRRYGGDLQGVIDELPYVESLGVTALYLNPVNDSPSLHKYDARTYRHVDPHFGPDPEGDKRIIASEDLSDPSTWQFTAADRLFLDLVRTAHERDIRVVLDYSWNHTGSQHPAFQDVLANGRDSRYADWYQIDEWDDPSTPGVNEFAYTGWAGVAELPELRKVNLTGDPADGRPFEGDLDPAVKEHIFAVSRRWLDPDGDGDPSDGVDGFRLDVAEMVPLGFWRDYRHVVKDANPEAILIGEIWWQRWPNVMMNPAAYLGDVFDSVMHYRPFAPLRQLVAPGGPQISPVEFGAHLDSVYADVPRANLTSLMTMSGSHDTPRLATTLFNTQVAYKHEETPRNTPGYNPERPNAATWRSVELFRLIQFTLPGAPQIYYGDEVGMWGADDPDNRKPMVWDDLRYDAEASSPDGSRRRPDGVQQDSELVDFTRSLVALRLAHMALFARGELEWESDGDVLRFRRTLGGISALVVVNLSARALPSSVHDAANLVFVAGDEPTASTEGFLIPARSGAVFRNSSR